DLVHADHDEEEADLGRLVEVGGGVEQVEDARADAERRGDRAQRIELAAARRLLHRGARTFSLLADGSHARSPAIITHAGAPLHRCRPYTPSKRARGGQAMIVRLDHVGVVAHSWGEASDVLVERLGFPIALNRTQMPEGNLYAPQNTRIYFVKVGEGETLIE